MITGAPFVPMSKAHVREVISMANIHPNDVLMDLGSGDGRILFAAQRKAKHCIGVEINPFLYWISTWKAAVLRYKNITVIRKDLWKTDLSDVDVLTLFFIAPKMDKLHKKIMTEMKPGSRVVSYGFKFPNWQFFDKRDKVYLYIVQ